MESVGSKDGENASYGAVNSDSERSFPVLSKTQSSNFLDDLVNFKEGSVPQSAVVAVVIGTVCGIAAFIYYKILFSALDLIWKTIPLKYIEGVWNPNFYVLYIPLVGFSMAICLGLTVKYIGEPGDLAYTIKCVHEKAYIAMSHVLPMVCASQFSILGGGSLGPEAPLVAICAALGGFISRKFFLQTNRNVVRKHTLMGMAGALGAFFGSPLGGSLFALEVNSRFGIEYFEHMVEAIFCGEITLAVFRGLSGVPIAPIWSISATKIEGANPSHVFIGAIIGLMGAGIAALFSHFHWMLMDCFEKFGLLDNDKAVYRGCVGAIVVVGLGMLVPQTLFWGEFEFQTISTMSDAKTLSHVWPTTGLLDFEMRTASQAFIVGVCKMVAISFTVAGGYRGGFIFPFFAAGAAFGNVVHFIFPFVPVSLACLSFAAGINVAITRTSLATSIILCFLAGEQNAMTGVLSASLVSLFITGYMPFIKTQQSRNDLDSSLFFYLDQKQVEPEEKSDNESQYVERAPLTEESLMI